MFDGISLLAQDRPLSGGGGVVGSVSNAALRTTLVLFPLCYLVIGAVIYVTVAPRGLSNILWVVLLLPSYFAINCILFKSVEEVKFNYAHLLVIVIITLPIIPTNSESTFSFTFLFCTIIFFFLPMDFLLSNVVMRLEGWFHVDNIFMKEHVPLEQMRQHQFDICVIAYDKDYSSLLELQSKLSYLCLVSIVVVGAFTIDTVLTGSKAIALERGTAVFPLLCIPIVVCSRVNSRIAKMEKCLQLNLDCISILGIRVDSSMVLGMLMTTAVNVFFK